MNIVFFGTPDFAIPSLDKIYNSHHKVLSVVTNIPKKSGRGNKLNYSPIELDARQKGLPIINVEHLNDENFYNSLKSLNADIFIIVAFRILPKKIFSIPKFGTVNLHASLLPKYRGSAPIHHAILNDERYTGVTTFKIDSKVDTGGIYLQKQYKIDNDATTGMVWEDLANIGADLLVDTINGIEDNTLQPKMQNDIEATSAPKIKNDDFALNWGHSSRQIYNRIRAFSPYPGAYTSILNKRLKIFVCKETKNKSLHSGQFSFDNEKLLVGTGTNDLEIIYVQLEGKKKMSATDFYRGIKNKLTGKELSFV